ncbi:MAG: DUF4198 domain-containing protein [Dechloromonas sp.]|nr:DUF4198 domain-containing protein [Dechloromonas sp.]
MLICRKMTPIAVAGVLLFAAGAARAHYLWLETDESEAHVLYGEAEAALREKSPGKLDNMNVPRVLAVPAGSPATALPVSRSAGYFVVAGAGPAATLLAAEESADVRDLSKYGLGMAKSNYYARHGQRRDPAADSALVLDVVALEPNRLTVLYRGRPLKDAKVEVIAPNTWVQEHKADAQGNVVINTPWRGRYVVHVLHIDPTPGVFEGKRYDTLRNHFTYSFSQAAGADPGPAVPPRQGAD